MQCVERERQIDVCQSIVMELITYATLTLGELFLSRESKQYGKFFHIRAPHTRIIANLRSSKDVTV